jgi:UDP-glucuronate decarboxylase
MKTNIIQKDIDSIIKEFSESLHSLSGKTILITGGNGFIASYIVDVITTFNKQLNNPCKLIIINKNPITSESRLSHLMNNPDVEFLLKDIGKPFEINKKIDIIIHAASRANPTSFLENPLDTIDTNINGLRTLLDFAKNNPVENFLFFSSGEIYGNPPEEFIPIPEIFNGNVSPISDRACYTESKRFGETLCSVFFKKYNVPTKILRLFHTYGPGLRSDGKVITDFFNNAKNKGEITLRDKGDSTIAFCYISDTITGIFKILFKGENGEAYNLGNNDEAIPIKKLAEIIASFYGDIPVSTTDNKDFRDNYKIVKRMPDISKLKSLGFEPKISMEEGLMKMHLSDKEQIIKTTQSL